MSVRTTCTQRSNADRRSACTSGDRHGEPVGGRVIAAIADGGPGRKRRIRLGRAHLAVAAAVVTGVVVGPRPERAEPAPGQLRGEARRLGLVDVVVL